MPLEVRTGAELAHDDVALLGDAELEAIAQGPPGARWVLLEAPLFGGDLDGFLRGDGRGARARLRDADRASRALRRADGGRRSAVAAERRAGARLQVNGSSLTGRHGAARAGARDRAAAHAARPT